MLYSTIALSLLASSGALAAPYSYSSYDTSISVVLTDQSGASAQLSFTEGIIDAQFTEMQGPFTKIELKVGQDVQQPDLRCAALDDAGNDVVVLRGNNTDVSFSDGGKGAWTFLQPSLVSEVICDPGFQKIAPEDLAAGSTLRVVLQSQSTETGSQTEMAPNVRDVQMPVGSSGPFETVELRVGKFVRKDYRCQILDADSNPIALTRGANKADSFGDAGKGEWTLDYPSEVSHIICDPTLVK